MDRSKKGKLTKSVLRSTDVDGDIEISHPEEEEAASDQSLYNVDSDLAQSASNASLQDICGPCKLQEESETRKPESYCTECDDFLCKQCTSYHKVVKATRNHTLVNYDEKMKTSRQRPCRPCKENEDGGKIVPSTWYCRECDDFLCDSCRSYHRTVKVTRGHTLITTDDQYKEEKLKNLLGVNAVSQIALPNVADTFKTSEKPNKQREIKTKPVAVSSSKPYLQRNAELRATYNVQLPEDKNKPGITGSSFISDSSLLLADNDNNCLKLFHLQDSGLKFVTKEAFDSRIRDVCVHDASEVSVTVGGHIIRLSVTGNKIKQKKTLPCPGFCCLGIAYINKDTLAAVGYGPLTFCVLTTDGIILWEITSDMEGQPLPYGLCFVALNNNKTTAYMTCLVEAVMYTVDIQSRKVKSLLKLTEGSGPRGVTVDADDNVYVCNHIANTIQQISPDGAHIRTLVTGNVLDRPQTISFSPDRNTFVVGSSYLGNGEKIQLFSMQ